MKRDIRVKSIHNIRDLGGLTNKDGKTIKRSLLIRSGELNKVSIKNINYLKEEYKLKKIIDLRNDEEKQEKPDINIEGIIYMHVPVLKETRLGITREEKLHIKEYAKNLPDMKEMYRDFINNENCKENLAKALKEIIRNRDGSILWHCSAGKDRCGMVSAYILSLLDVDEEEILKDYLYSNKDAYKVARKYYFLVFLVTRSFKVSKIVYDLFIADKEYFMAAINEIKKKYDNINEYLYNELKIDKEEVKQFKDYVLNEKHS